MSPVWGGVVMCPVWGGVVMYPVMSLMCEGHVSFF